MILRRRLLSQNFLTNDALVAHLVRRAGFGKNDLVIDIGAGTGIITRELAKTGAQIVAVEIDSRLVSSLRQNLQNFRNVETHQADIRQFVLPSIPYKVFSNLPFHLTADIIYKLLYFSNPPTQAYLIMQREAAEKFSGFPHESQFSILAKPLFDFSIIWHFQDHDFSPRPGVKIVMLQIRRKEAPLISSEEDSPYKSFIKHAFGSWKRDLKAGLADTFTYNQWRRLAKDNHFAIHAKPTDLTFDQWLSVFRFYKSLT